MPGFQGHQKIAFYFLKLESEIVESNHVDVSVPKQIIFKNPTVSIKQMMKPIHFYEE